MSRRRVLVREGSYQSGASLGLTVVIAGVIAVSSSAPAGLATRVAIAGVVVLAVALALGSARLVGVATLPVLGSAMIASITADEPTWVRSIVLGCLWYVAAELAWEAIERRDAADRTRAFDDRRVQEVATVVTLALASASAGSFLSFVAPVRTVLTVGLAMVALLVALMWANRHVTRLRSREGPATEG